MDRESEFFKNRRVLVTGGCGFVGQNLVNNLLNKGCQVTVTSTGSEPKIENVHKILYSTLEGIDWKYVRNQDILIHLMANNDTLFSDEQEMMRANFYGPIKLFESAQEGGCKNFIYASSTAVYGDSPAPYTENTKINPLNVYGKSKAEFDDFAMEFAKKRSVNVKGFRFCNIYGPGEERKGKRMSMIGQMLRQIIGHKNSITLFKDGNQKRDWVHVYDVVDALISSTLNICSINGGEIYNLGSGTSHTFNEVARVIQEEYAARGFLEEIKVEYIDCPFLKNYQTFTECNIEKARRELNYSPSFDLRSGIKQYLQYLLG